MAAPSMVHAKGDTLVIRSVVDGEDLYGADMRKRIEESVSNAFLEQNIIQDNGDEPDLPQCKIKRNYACNSCDYFTQNPRTYLHHLRDVHFEKIKIYECQSCLYASKHSQKLQRHIHMVHVMGSDTKKRQSNKNNNNNSKPRVFPPPAAQKQLPVQVISTPTIPALLETNVSNTDSDESPMMEDDLQISSPINQGEGSEKQFRCSLCMFFSHNANLVSRHERVFHSKKKTFKCHKCNYVTHMKARFTKHVKYHSMPMIKCELCDFRTPYKWNLDRHWKNHTGEGAFKCSLCNFTADIKQSLTVHEMNHHVPTAGQAAMRRRNRVGGSDLFQEQEEEANDMDEQEMLRLEREDQNSSDMQNEAEDQHYTDMRTTGDNSDSDTGSVNQQGHHYGGDIDSNSNEALNLQNSFLKLNQCRVCSFKSAWESELKHHEAQTHGLTDLGRGLPSPPQEEKKKPARPIPNLIPIQGPPVDRTSPSPETGKSDPMSDKDLNDIYAKQCPNSALKDFASVIGGVDVFNNTPTDLSFNDAEKTNDSNSSAEENKKYPDLFKKKNASFFDKLKERLMTTTSNEPGNNNLHCKHCPHVSKCLSEYILHQKLHSSLDGANVPSPSSVATSSTGSPIHNGGSASTRCQFCRQRCKSSGDLLIHLQMCSQALANEESQHSQSSSSEAGHHGARYQQDKENEEGEDLRTSSSRVFVWNNIPTENHPNAGTRTPTPDPPVIHSTPSPSVSNTTEDQGWRSKSPSESSLMGFETTPGYGSVTSKTKSGSHGHMNPNPLPDTNGGSGRGELTLKKVYKCPHCAFWASTASRFHVHIVGHLNKKPFECSLCAYRSNWRWDITKHIRLKTIRDPAHEAAKVLMTDETGRRNYTKYNKYLTLMKVHEPNAESSGSGKRSNQHRVSNTLVTNSRLPFPMSAPPFMGEMPFKTDNPFQRDGLFQVDNPFKRPAPSFAEEEPSAKLMKSVASAHVSPSGNDGSGSKKTMWKCKKCLFKDGDKSVVLAHVKDHYRDASLNRLVENGMENMTDDCEVKNMTIAKLHEQSLAEHNNNNISKDDVARITSEEDEDQQFILYCEMCEFKTTSSADYDIHLSVHYPRESSNNVSYRCYKCSFSSMSKSTLMEHLQSHGIQEDMDMIYSSYAGRHLPRPPAPIITSEVKKFKCSLCPYVSNNRSQFDSHRQFHHSSGAAFQCSLCSYAVSKRHLLQQHMRVHGVEPSSPSNSKTTSLADDSREEVPDTPADISGKDTSKCKEIPLVWVSRNGSIAKMHKCRFCPHVNVRKSNIQEHEKMHSTRSPKLLPDGTSAPPLQQHYCPDCNYICNNAGVLSSHAKVHQGLFGTVCALYDSSRKDDEQIKEVLEILSTSRFAPKQEMSDNEAIETTPDISALLQQSGQSETETEDEANASSPANTSKVKAEPILDNKDQIKRLHFCSKCPARFLFEKELMIHSKFHSLQLNHKCWSCSYTARQEQHLQAHYKVHTSEYQDRTKVLLTMYSESTKYPRNNIAVVLENPGTPGYIWVVVNDASSQSISVSNPPFSLNFNINNTIINNKVKDTKRSRVITKQFSCTKCPAQFFKSVALQYHLTLHGGNGPHKCRSCDYAVKTYGNLIKHEQVHDTLAPRIKCKVIKPPRLEPNPTAAFAKPEYHMKNIDPEFGFFMLGNPNFNYPTYIKNGKVKTKRYKCHKCPSAFEKREQYKVHLSLHGAQQKYKCNKCDYSVKYYANYIQHTRKHEKSESFDDVINSGEMERPPCEDVRPQVKAETGKPQRKANNMTKLKEDFHLCKFCPYASTNLSALQNHIQKHHNIPQDIAQLLQRNGSSLTLEQPSSHEDKLSTANLKVEEAELVDFNEDNMDTDDMDDDDTNINNADMDDVDSYNDEPDDYDEDLERKFVLSSMRNGGTLPVEDLDDIEDNIDATDDKYGYLDIHDENVSDSDDGEDNISSQENVFS